MGRHTTPPTNPPCHRGRHATGTPQPGPAAVTIRPRPGAATALFGTSLAVGAWIVHNAGTGFVAYGIVLSVILGAKLALSLTPARRHPHTPPPGLRVGVVIPVYNEDPTAFIGCLQSVLEQTWRPVAVLVVDDGSDDPRASVAAEQFARRFPAVRVTRMGSNAGKRAATRAAIQSCTTPVDVWCTVDSDTILHPDAVLQGCRPFNDRNVTATTGTVLALNTAGLLPRLIGLRYVNAFLGERAAYSRLGSVLCCCGSLAFYRSWLIDAVADEWVGQSFLGQPVNAGDDRRLTKYALDAGRVELATGAIGFTVVPERFRHLVRQQIRWGRSFWRESLLMLRDGSPRRAAWWLTGLEVVSSVAFTTALAAAAWRAFGAPGSALPYLGWIAVTSWARSVHVLSVRGMDRVHEQLMTFALAPVYGAMSLFVLLPLRVWSLVTVRVSAWGTRADGAEVSLEPGRAAA